MKTFKQLLEQIDETLSLFVEEVDQIDELSEPTVRTIIIRLANKVRRSPIR